MPPVPTPQESMSQTQPSPSAPGAVKVIPGEQGGHSDPFSDVSICKMVFVLFTLFDSYLQHFIPSSPRYVTHPHTLDRGGEPRTVSNIQL